MVTCTIACAVGQKHQLWTTLARSFSASSPLARKHYKLLIAGGGSGGVGVAAKFGPVLGKGHVAVIEPRDQHFYQPYWTLVGGGLKKFQDSYKPMRDVINKNCDWIQEQVAEFQPDKNLVVTESGKEVLYDYLVIALGISLRYEFIKGLPDAFETPGLCSNYDPVYVLKTFKCIQAVKSGNVIFSFPNTPIKCPGAPQKIMYIAEHYFRKHGVKANIFYNTNLPFLFAVEYYREPLMKIVRRKNIHLNTRHNLVEVDPVRKVAIFDVHDDNGALVRKATFPYDMLHVAPPCAAPTVLERCKKLSDSTGFLNVDPYTLQHVKYQNIFGIGDCMNSSNSKTMASISKQLKVVRKNLTSVMENKTPVAQYDGYASCPFITDYGKGILAEFTYNCIPKETTPLDQRKEMWMSYFLKKEVMSRIYWHLYVRKE